MDLAGVDLSRILVVVGPMFAGPMFAGPMFAGPQDGPQDGPRAVIGGPAGLAARMRDLGAHALVGAPGTTSMTSGTEMVMSMATWCPCPWSMRTSPSTASRST